MKYPKFLNEKYNTIGVCAMSSGVGHKLDSFNASIDYIQFNGFHIVETASVRNDNEPSIDAKTRVDELNSLVNDSSVGAVWRLGRLYEVEVRELCQGSTGRE